MSVSAMRGDVAVVSSQGSSLHVRDRTAPLGKAQAFLCLRPPSEDAKSALACRLCWEWLLLTKAQERCFVNRSVLTISSPACPTERESS